MFPASRKLRVILLQDLFPLSSQGRAFLTSPQNRLQPNCCNTRKGFCHRGEGDAKEEEWLQLIFCP